MATPRDANLAALMGHLDIVEFLIERGAALTHDGFHASSYVGDEGLAARRRDFYLRTVKIGREHPDASNTRKTIHDILSCPGRRSVFSAMKGPRADIGFPDYRLAKQGRDIVVYAPVLRVKTDIALDRNKTIGVITAKGDGNVLMAAHSGFRLAGDRDEKCLDTNKWNYIALHHIAALLKFHFPGNRHDNGNKPVEDEHRGRAHAGHVEVLLAAWYALELTKKSSGNHDADLEWLLTQLHTLKRATLGHARSAVIMIDSQPCATCLKFINRLFQYTGLHFSVKGGVGIGPTLATKDKYNNRYDTFGDVFEMSDGEDSTDSADTGLQSPPTIVRAQDATGSIRDMIEEDVEGDGTIIQAQAASEAFARVSNSRFSPILDMDTNSDTDDVSPTTPLAIVAPSRAPITPMRPRMQWPIPEPATRARIAVEDPFRDIPSHRPENHLELLAEYKKKTPVFDFPGYESVSPEYRAIPKYRPQHPTPRAAAAGPFTTSIFTATEDNNSSPEPLEDTILVDMTEDNEDVGYPSPGGSSGTTTLRNSMIEVNSRINTNTNTNPNHNSNNGANTPSPPSRAPAIFSYSSFAPISSQSQRESDACTSGEKHQSQHQVQVQALSQVQAQSQGQTQAQAPAHTQNQTQTQTDPVHSDIHMQSCSSDSDNDPENEDDREYYYVPKAHPHPHPHPHSHPHPHPHPQPPRMRLRFDRPPGEALTLTPNSTSTSTSNNDTDSESEHQRGRDPTPCPVPVHMPGVTRLQQWRYQPQPQPQPQALRARTGVRAGGSERFIARGPGAGLGRSVTRVQRVTAGPFLGGLEGGFGKKG
ncbi:hypothetical protein F4776DRAFT_373373 [Hypoxylon sp. NC0597]|nr:hypothetical protein F4776DRAFT_373373 [Hypoxylon sp. NC0597]